MQDVEVGVPQSTCLGPLLFLIYINDLPLAVQGSTVSMYADDTSLCHQALHMTQLNGAINNDLKRMDTWLQGNKLSLNVAKTHSMFITAKQKHNFSKVQISLFCLFLCDLVLLRYFNLAIHIYIHNIYIYN